MTSYERILREGEEIARLYGLGSELQRMDAYLRRREAWSAVQREHGAELRAIVGACFEALLGWTR